jgi:hypothetical protein
MIVVLWIFTVPVTCSSCVVFDASSRCSVCLSCVELKSEPVAFFFDEF